MTADLLNSSRRVYVGQDRACRCGCKGSYYEAGSREFKSAITRFRKLLAKNEDADLTVAETYLNLSFGENRAICAYFRS